MLRGYSYSLACRFVSDYKLPIAICNEEEFEYELNLFEKNFGSMTKWENLITAIRQRYGEELSDEDCAEKFLDDYGKVRNDIIMTVSSSDAYKLFNSDKNEKYAAASKYKYPKTKAGSKGVYNESNIGHHFVSIDMKNANFQVLKYCGVIKDNTYHEFISRFTDNELICDYISNSKYTRQVVFGKLNPQRTTTIEKYIMASEIFDVLVNVYGSGITGRLVSINSDELILEDDDHTLYEKIIKWTEGSVKLPVDVRIEEFTLEGYIFGVTKPDASNHKLGEFYHRSCDAAGKYKGIPLPYHKILYKLLNRQKVELLDRRIMFDKCRATIEDTIYVKDRNLVIKDLIDVLKSFESLPWLDVISNKKIEVAVTNYIKTKAKMKSNEFEKISWKAGEADSTLDVTYLVKYTQETKNFSVLFSELACYGE